jgi:signal peptide peptidase SppA
MNLNPNVFESNILAIAPERMASIIESRKMAMTANVQDAINRTPTKYGKINGNIAIVPVRGFISNHASIWSMMGLESSSEVIAAQVQQAMDDPSVGAVILDIDSPGGTVYGLSSASEKIFSFRGKKPLTAIANGLMASAAYFLGSAADEVVADNDAEVGSIGSVMVHIDYTDYLQKEGIKATVIRSDEKKFKGSPYEPLDDETKSEFQAVVNRYADMFIAKVALYRDVKESEVRAKFGNGGVLSPLEAKNVGMIDKIGSMDGVISRMMGMTKKPNLSKINAVALAKNMKIQSRIRRQPVGD